MHKTTELLDKYGLCPKKYTIIKSVKLIDTDHGTFVMKPKKRMDKSNVYQYLLSRNFDCFPRPINDVNHDSYEIFPYVIEFTMPKEQKAVDLMYLMSLLHNKTTFYKEVDLDDVKNFYEETSSKLQYLEQYYFDLQNTIENNVYMSPSEYLLMRNISRIYSAIYFCKNALEHWYQLITSKKNQRYVMTHNALELDHFIKSEHAYLISWDHAKIDLPIYDFYHFYKKHYYDLDFVSLLQIYESKYPLLEEEKTLLFLLLSIPEKIVLDQDEFKKCQEISEFFIYMDKTNALISKQNTNQAHEQTA